MPLSSLAKDCDSFSVIDEALSFFPQGFSKIPHLESYDPTSAEDNDFIENTIGLLAFKSADDETCRALLEHVRIRAVVIEGVNTMSPETQQGLLAATVNCRNHALLKCLAELGFNLGLKDKYGKDPFQGVAEQGQFTTMKEMTEEGRSKDLSERSSIRIILESGQTELESKELIEFVLFGLDRHLISLRDDLNINKLAPGKNRFEEFFGPKNKDLINAILQAYGETNLEKSEIARSEMRDTYKTFGEITKEATLEKNQVLRAEIAAETSTAKPASSPKNTQATSVSTQNKPNTYCVLS